MVLTKTDLPQIYRLLQKKYGEQQSWWPAETPVEMVIGAFLTQNTAWTNVEKAIINLRKADALNFEKLLTLDDSTLQEYIRPSGFFRQKSRYLKLFAEELATRWQGDLQKLLNSGPIEEVRGELLKLTGIGPETADSILLYAGNRASFVVDAYTGRIFTRLGYLAGDESYRHIQQWFVSALPEEANLFKEYHALIVIHAKSCCTARKPVCRDCPLQSLCQYMEDHNNRAETPVSP